MTDELSPARQALLKSVVDIQERMLNGCIQIFLGLSNSKDPEVSGACTVALEHLETAHDTIEAMIDGLNATQH